MQGIRLIHAFILVLTLTNVSRMADAALVTLEPDDYAPLTDLRNVRPDVTLSITGQPAGTVLFSAPGSVYGGCGGNCASTGISVFSYVNTLNAFWQFGVAAFRADFSSPTDFVSIDFVGIDDGDVQAQAFDTTGTQISSFLVHIGHAGDNQTALFFRPTADIAYIIAGGVPGEGVLLDNLRFDSLAVSAPPPLAIFLLLSLALTSKYRRRSKISERLDWLTGDPRQSSPKTDVCRERVVRARH